MKEYQFKIHNVVLDVHAESEEEAVRTLNDSLHLLDEPLPAPGRIQRVLVDVQEPVSTKNIVEVYDFDTHESYEPNAVNHQQEEVNREMDWKPIETAPKVCK